MANFVLKCIGKGKRKDSFLLRVFLSKDGSIGFARQCNDFDGHSMVSKIVIEFFLGFTTMKLGEFVYRLAFYVTYVAAVGLRAKNHPIMDEIYTLVNYHPFWMKV